MNEFKKMIINLKYYLLCKSEEFILNYLESFKNKIDIWINLGIAGKKCANELSSIDLEVIFSKREEKMNAEGRKKIINLIADIIQLIEDGIIIKKIISFVQDYPTCCSIVLDRIIDQCNEYKKTKISMEFISIGLEDITYKNPDINWYYTDFLHNLSSLGIIQVTDKEVCLLRPELIITARERIGPNPESII